MMYLKSISVAGIFKMLMCTTQKLNHQYLVFCNFKSMDAHDLIGRECQPSVTRQHNEQLRQIMCYVCCKELKGWCKSFTRTEGFLSILEAILLVVFISFLVFLILHFVACRKYSESGIPKPPEGTTTTSTSSTTRPVITTTSTLPPDVECTWLPSRQTSAATHYYLPGIHETPGGSPTTPFTITTNKPTSESLEIFGENLEPSHEYDDVEFLEHSDGEFAEDNYKSQVVALVKLKPPGDVTFGCILTKITKFWTLTAASCIESIEEVDSLDSFIILEDFGEARQSRARTVSDVQLHPQYGGRNRSFDVAVLRSDRALRGRADLLRLPSILDYFLVAIGERFHILGYGGYRTVDKSPTGRRLRQVSVYVTASAQCAGADGQWAPRHLARGGRVQHGACGAAPLCAGARYSRGTPCNYCAGTPLLRDGTLFGIMSDNSACAVACEPQLYVNIATLRDWIDSVID